MAAGDPDGCDPHVVDACVRAIVNRAVPAEERATAVTRFDGDEFDLGGFLAACRTVPMFSATSVVLCRRTEKLHIEAQGAVADALAALPETTVVILLAGKLDGRLKFTKGLKKLAQWIEVDAGQDPAALGAWVGRRFSDLDKTIDARMAYAMAEKVKRPAALAQQVEQIALYLGDAPQVTQDAVEALWRGAPSDNVFAITDAIGARDAGAALHAFTETERAGAHYLQVLALVESAVRRLVAVRDGMDAGLGNDAIAERLGIKSGAVYYQRQRAEAWGAADLRRVHRAVLDLDYKTKSAGGDPRLRLEAFLVDACS